MAKKIREGQLGLTGGVEKFGMALDNVQYNPSSISLFTYNEMRFFPAISAALKLVSLPIQAVDWYIKLDPALKEDKIRKELEEDFRPLFAELLRDMCIAFSTGYVPFEKVFTFNKRYKYDKLVALDPNITKPRIEKRNGNFDGIVQQTGVQNEDIVIDKDYSFVFTHQKEYGNLYGIPRTRGAYSPWFLARYIYQYAGNFFERFSTPQMIGYTMAGKTKYKGEEVDNVDYMLKMLKSLQNASVAAFPKSSKKKDELDHYIEILESARTGADHKQFLEYLDLAMFMGCAVPQLAFSSGSKGSYALGDTQIDTFFMGIDGELLEIASYVDKYLINPLVELNYSPKYKNMVHWVYQPLSKQDKKLVKDVLFAIVQQGNATIALDFLRESLGIPVNIDLAPKLKQEGEEKKEEKPIQVEKIAKFSMSRKPNKLEGHVNFDKIKKMYDSNEEEILKVAKEILDKQKETLIKNIEKAIMEKDPNRLKNMDIPYKAEYENKIADLSKRIFEEGMEDVQAEMKLGNIKLPAEAKAWVITRAKNIAEKHMADLKFDVIGAALTGMSKELSEKEIINNSILAFDTYANVELVDSSIILNHKFYNEGRDWTADEAGIKQAEWSAVLDNNTCPYCESRDGMIINLSDPDFSQFAPGNVHENCRCIWIFIDGEEMKTTWKSPSKNDQKVFYMSRR